MSIIDVNVRTAMPAPEINHPCGMATMQSFKRYTWGESGTSLLERAVDWDGAPVDGPDVVRATGLDADDDLVVVGVLTTPWNGHPAGALVVSELMITGAPFAVGNEAAH